VSFWPADGCPRLGLIRAWRSKLMMAQMANANAVGDKTIATRALTISVMSMRSPRIRHRRSKTIIIQTVNATSTRSGLIPTKETGIDAVNASTATWLSFPPRRKRIPSVRTANVNRWSKGEAHDQPDQGYPDTVRSVQPELASRKPPKDPNSEDPAPSGANRVRAVVLRARRRADRSRGKRWHYHDTLTQR